MDRYKREGDGVMSHYRINLTLINNSNYTYKADKFIVVDSKLEIIIDGSVISYDFDLIDGLTIWKEEDK